MTREAETFTIKYGTGITLLTMIIGLAFAWANLQNGIERNTLLMQNLIDKFEIGNNHIVQEIDNLKEENKEQNIKIIEIEKTINIIKK